MKKNKTVFSVVILLLLLAITGMQTLSAMDIMQSFQQANSKTTDEGIQGRKTLIIYYSRSGHTREAAKKIQAQTGGDLLEIETAKPYPREYADVVQQAKQEIEADYKPEIKTKVENIASYDVVFIGSPIWWGTIAPPVASFLAKNDLAGKTVVPFVTHAGSGLAIEGSKVNEANEKITSWLSRLQVSE
ncbi:flavodoxin [uncultured Anaeromusa sp.]|uniref:flavodoxin n=1 Tax=uncultured Anaeromusa sp. TaxID=673273 RepID=UPI0029C956C9|nr:flavodoxin [uncultured Anaeromusa sp.]